jgi:predicted nucleotidyltransferase component of viral defense system
MKDTAFHKQVELLLDVLPFVAKHDVFALKGGTAINFFLRDLPRLSVDIDLTYIPITERREALTDVTHHLCQIKHDLEERIGAVVVAKSYGDTGNWKGLVVTRPDATIKIEPNLIMRGSVFPPESRSLTPKVEAIYECAMEMVCLTPADLYGGKICAALDRQHPRDLFDVRLLLHNEGLTKEIRNAFIVYLISHNRPMVELLDPGRQNLQALYEQEFVGLAREPISLEELLAVREKLVDLIKNQLTQEERQFLFSVKQGEPDWDLLKMTGIADLPAVQWKLINIRKMSPTDHHKAIRKLQNYLEL